MPMQQYYNLLTMPGYQTIPNLSTNLRVPDHDIHKVLIKKICDDFLRANKVDIEELLETVVNVSDFDLQVKLFSTLSTYLISKGEFYDVILTCNRLYDIIYNALNNGISQRTTTILNFISSLLYIDENDSSRRKTLILYAQNMLRVCGCLTTMNLLFCNTMMYKDTWKSLCRALAETCKGCDQNQSHCSHLIPVCIQKLRQKHIDVFTVLLSLIQNNVRNINIFMEANGISVFTRENLQLDFCLQLLNSIVEQSSDAANQIQNTSILNHLRDLLKAYGPTSQVGQWATVIIFHVNEQFKKSCNNKTTSEKMVEHSNNANRKLRCNDVFYKATEEVPVNPDDTSVLLTNIVKEIHSWQSQSRMNNLRLNSFQNKQNSNTLPNRQMPSQLKRIKSVLSGSRVNYNVDMDNENGNKEMSFSFVDKQIKQFSNMKLRSQNYSVMKSFTTTKSHNKTSKKFTSKTNQHSIIINDQPHNLLHDLSFMSDNHRSLTYKSDFKPNVMSTPKQKINTYQDTTIKQKKIRDYDLQKIPMKKQKYKQDLSTVKQVTNRSMSTRFFDVINESCTTVMKTFKSIFKPKVTKDSLRQESTSNSAVSSSKLSCSYSFTNYMKKRDAILADGYKYESDKDSSRSVNACKTCNDTMVLQHKVINDKNLKRTLKKLKLGINIYGCDFKKISKSLWPREKYMTPSVLYHLYRKLIAKH